MDVQTNGRELILFTMWDAKVLDMGQIIYTKSLEVWFGKGTVF